MQHPISHSTPHDRRSLLHALLSDGRPLLLLTGVCLVLAGGFALFLALTRQFLPHDIAFLGLTAEQLCAVKQCRLVGFMIHDRIAFGGALLAIGILYLWLTEFPLRSGEPWAWWLLTLSGLLGFGSFLSYLGYGYLDTWHGLATLWLLPCFASGLIRTWQVYVRPQPAHMWWYTPAPLRWRSRLGVGRLCLLLTAAGMIGAGMTILVIGTTVVFVPQDLHFIGLQPRDLHGLNSRLIPLIAHDRAGFGGAVATTGMVILGAVWYSRPTRHLWQGLCLAGTAGFGTALGAHPLVGYVDLIHLAPAVLGALLFLTGLVVCYRPMMDATDTA